VERPEFLKVLKQFPESSAQEAEAVLTLKENFPFSQVLHTLSARVSKDHKFSNSGFELQMAAVYSADRGVLKDIMQSGIAGLSQRPDKASAVESRPQDLPDDLANTVLQDLAKLYQLRQNFELLFTGGPVSVQTAAAVPHVTPVNDVPVRNEIDEHSAIKSKKERIVQLAKTLTAPIEETIIQVEPGFKTRKRKKDAMDTFIDQIVVNKKELLPESEKHKAQIQLIDHFIKIQPSISGSKEKAGQNDDLSTIKTGEFGDHIISETLVEILLKQGKREKAVEVLKKLIWKFPQKKAYFAAQIEELRK
jgi:hypothetical protein